MDNPKQSIPDKGAWVAIVNPMAASGRGERYWRRVSALMHQQNIPFELHLTQHKGHAMELAAQAILRGERKLLAVGGDGTVNEVANAILNQTEVPSTDILLAQLPVGTGNDWGRTIGIPSDGKAAVRMLKSGKPYVMDAGLLQYDLHGQSIQRWFVNIAGLGFDAYVGLEANDRKAKGRGGKLGYLFLLVKCLFNYTASPIVVEVDGQHHKLMLFSMAIANCRYNGGGMMQAPNASPDDGILDLTIIREITRWGVIKNIRKLFTGEFVNHPAVLQLRGKSIRIRAPKPVLVEVDGEDLGTTPIAVSIRQRCLRVLVR